MEVNSSSANTNKIKYKRINVSILCLLVLSLVFQLVGVLTPGWQMIHNGWAGRRDDIGIWYVKFCPDLEPCVVKFAPALTDSLDEDGFLRHHLLEYQVCSTLAIASCIGGIVAIVMTLTNKVAKTTETEVKKCFIFCFIGMLALISGSLTMEIAGAYGSRTKKLHDTYQQDTSSRPPVLYFPYSVFLVFLGGLTAVVVWLIIIFMRPWRFAPGTNYQLTNGGLSSTATHYPPSPTSVGKTVTRAETTVTNSYSNAYYNPTMVKGEQLPHSYGTRDT